MLVQIIQVPYDSGRLNSRCGAGPDHFINNGVETMLVNEGHEVTLDKIRATSPFLAEIGTAIELSRLIATSVKGAIRSNKLPIVLSGNCNSCLGTISGLSLQDLGVIWFDAHGDFNTPDTTESGFFDGMCLAMCAGLGWQSLLNTIPGFLPVVEQNIIHVGSRDLDIAEENLFSKSRVELITGKDQSGRNLLKELEAAVYKLKLNCQDVYLHIDLDVLDRGDAQANYLPVLGGLSCGIIMDMIACIRENLRIRACCVASFDPSYDKGHRVLNDGLRLIRELAVGKN